MAEIALRSKVARPDDSHESVTKSLELALSEFGSILNDEERKQLQQIKGVPDASAALVFTAQLDASNSTRRGKSIGARAFSMMKSIQRFSAIVGTFVSAHPEIAALVWGSAQITLLIAANFTSYFESLADLFMSLNRLFPQFDQYQLLFPNSKPLRESICRFHASIVQLCKGSILLTRESWVKKMTSSLRSKLSPQIMDIENCSRDVNEAIALAKATSDRMEQDLQEQERQLASKHRKDLFIFASRSQRELEMARERQLQRDQDSLNKRRAKLLQALSTFDYEKTFHQSRKRRHVNTASWLFSIAEFISWKDNESITTFVLTGKLGCGKTVITSNVIEHLHCERTSNDEMIAYSFPRFDDCASLSATAMLKSIIYQCLQPDDVVGEVETQLRKLKNSDQDIETIETLFKYCASKYSKLYIILDALDELKKDQRNILLQALSSAISQPSSKAKLFLVGRSSILVDTQSRFPHSAEKTISHGELQTDIETYTREAINSRLEEETPGSNEQLILEDPNLAHDIVERLTGGADGMFLWVDYQITEICECTCDDEVREVLRSLPKNLGETFDRAMKRIAKRGSAKTASSIFQWVAVAKRALTLDELREALSYEPGTPYPIPGKRLNGLKRITAWCENLVQLDEELQIVQFAHSSVLQHILGEPSEPSLQSFHVNLAEADHFVGEICVTYLNSNEFETKLIHTRASLPAQLPEYIINETVGVKGIMTRMLNSTQRLKAQSQPKSINTGQSMIMVKNDLEDTRTALKFGHPFLEYASNNWLLHTDKFEEGKSETWKMWKQMIDGSHNLAKTPWSTIQFENRDSFFLDWFYTHENSALFLQIVKDVDFAELFSVPRAELVHRYAARGHKQYVRILLESSSKEDLLVGLHFSVSVGKYELVQLFLNAGADVNATDNGQTALLLAIESNYPGVAEKLIGAGANVNASTQDGCTALIYAVRRDNIDLVKQLIGARANVNASTQDGWTALIYAVRRDNIDLVKQLIGAGANVNTSTLDGWTALLFAVRRDNMDLVKQLIRAGANVNASTTTRWTALIYAVCRDNMDLVKQLIGAGAKVNTSTLDGWTAFLFAVRRDNIDLVKQLIGAGANVNAAATDGSTALTIAVGNNSRDVVEHLLEAGANVNHLAVIDVYTGKPKTALGLATELGLLEITALLKAFGARE